jgi:hypothetical protein
MFNTDLLTALTALVTSFFGGLAICLKLTLQVAKQIRETHEIIARQRSYLERRSTKVPPADNPE